MRGFLQGRSDPPDIGRRKIIFLKQCLELFQGVGNCPFLPGLEYGIAYISGDTPSLSLAETQNAAKHYLLPVHDVDMLTIFMPDALYKSIIIQPRFLKVFHQLSS